MKAAVVKALAQASEDALAEALGAAGKFPANLHMHAALAEEVGELANALLEHHRGNGVSVADVYAEAMQVAAMALRIAVEGSAEFAYVYEEASSKSFRPTGQNKKSKAPTTSVETHIHVSSPAKSGKSSDMSQADLDWIKRLVDEGKITPHAEAKRRAEEEMKRHIKDAWVAGDQSRFKQRLPDPIVTLGGGVALADPKATYCLNTPDPKLIAMPALGPDVALSEAQLASIGCCAEGVGFDHDAAAEAVSDEPEVHSDPATTPKQKAKPTTSIEDDIDHMKTGQLSHMTPFSKLAIINRLTAEKGVTECGAAMYGSEGKPDYGSSTRWAEGSPAQSVIDRVGAPPELEEHARVQAILDHAALGAPLVGEDPHHERIQTRMMRQERVEHGFRAAPFDRDNDPVVHCNRFG